MRPGRFGGLNLSRAWAFRFCLKFEVSWICGVKFDLLRRNLLKFKYFINGDFRLLVGKIYSRGDGFDGAISARLNLKRQPLFPSSLTICIAGE